MNPRLKEIETRKTEIRAELEKNDPKIDLDALEKELRALDAEKQKIEKREAMIAGINNDSIEARHLQNPMVPKEERKIEGMSREDALNAPEYRSAFLKTLLGKPMNDDEKRTMEIVNADVEKRAGYSVPKNG